MHSAAAACQSAAAAAMGAMPAAHAMPGWRSPAGTLAGRQLCGYGTYSGTARAFSSAATCEACPVGWYTQSEGALDAAACTGMRLAGSRLQQHHCRSGAVTGCNLHMSQEHAKSSDARGSGQPHACSCGRASISCCSPAAAAVIASGYGKSGSNAIACLVDTYGVGGSSNSTCQPCPPQTSTGGKTALGQCCELPCC